MKEDGRETRESFFFFPKFQTIPRLAKGLDFACIIRLYYSVTLLRHPHPPENKLRFFLNNVYTNLTFSIFIVFISLFFFFSYFSSFYFLFFIFSNTRKNCKKKNKNNNNKSSSSSNNNNNNNHNNNNNNNNNTEVVLENETRKLHWDFEIQTDQLISARRPDQIIINNNKKIITCKIVDLLSWLTTG